MSEENKSRTASDVLLSVENDLKQLMQMNKNLDLNVKILSNKINHVIEALLAAPTTNSDPVLFGEANPMSIALAPPAPQEQGFKMNIQEEFFMPKEAGLSTDTAPVGFRRTSRPETYSAATKEQKNIPTPSVQQPTMHVAKIEQSSTQHIPSTGNRIPVMQRIVDRNSKSLFMAQVEITNLQTNIVETKTRTSGVGKWQATLLPGNYKVTIRKNESLSKQNIEVSQTITIDANTPNELPMLIVK